MTFLLTAFGQRSALPTPVFSAKDTHVRIASLLVAALLALGLCRSASANLVQDGNFTSFTTYNGGAPLYTPVFGQIGTVSGNTYLTSPYWTSTGYNFVYSASNVDQGTQASGANAGQPLQSPGDASIVRGGNTIGTTYMWGTNNGGLKTFTDPPTGGNFIAADPVYKQGPISQTITGLVAGNVYALSFYWAAAQQQAYDGNTYESWTVTLGSESRTTPVYNLLSHDFSGWMQQTFYYTATSNSEVLSFMVNGGPGGLPPFALLAGVNLEIVPEASSGLMFAIFGVGCVAFRSRRRGHPLRRE